MSLWRHLTHGIRVLTRRSTADRALGDEVDHYLQEATAAYMDQGLSPEDAGRAARMEVGNALRVREEVRDAGWEHALETLIRRHLRYAVRAAGRPSRLRHRQCSHARARHWCQHGYLQRRQPDSV